jgi:2-iminobutanoate/2-iminopropanoate deaminase
LAIEHFATDDIPQPVTGNFSHAVRAGGFVFLSGAAPFDPATGEIPAGIEDQIRVTLSNLEAQARAAGASLSQAVRVGVYLRDMADFAALNRIYPEVMAHPLPARTTIQSDMEVSVEIDAVLYVGTEE